MATITKTTVTLDRLSHYLRLAEERLNDDASVEGMPQWAVENFLQQVEEIQNLRDALCACVQVRHYNDDNDYVDTLVVYTQDEF